MIQRYELQFKELLPEVVKQKSYLGRIFGEVQVTDGIAETDNAFVLKRNADAVTMNAYGSGDINSTSRFGNMVEIKYSNVQVPYTMKKASNEALDKFTVNNNLQEAVANRLLKASEAISRELDKDGIKTLTDNKKEDLTAGDANESSLTKLFNDAFIKMQEAEVANELIALVSPDLYTKLIDLGITTAAKGSTANVDDNTMRAFKGFTLVMVPKSLLGSDIDVIFTCANVGVKFAGIETARTIETDKFDGVAVQTATKAGSYIPEENKVAVYTGKITGLPEV